MVPDEKLGEREPGLMLMFFKVASEDAVGGLETVIETELPLTLTDSSATLEALPLKLTVAVPAAIALNVMEPVKVPSVGELKLCTTTICPSAPLAKKDSLPELPEN